MHNIFFLISLLMFSSNVIAEVDCTDPNQGPQCRQAAMQLIHSNALYGRDGIDPERGVRMIQASCRSAFVSACSDLIYQYESIRTEDPEFATEIKNTAIQTFDEFCSERSPSICVLYARALFDLGEQPEIAENKARIAEAALSAGCSDGNHVDCDWLASLYNDKRWSGNSSEKSLELYELACENGIVDSCFWAGSKHFCGGGTVDGCEPDFIRAAELLKLHCDATGLAYSCDQYKVSRRKQMDLAQTLNWLGDRLVKNGWVHHYEIQDCTIAIDNFDGVLRTGTSGTRIPGGDMNQAYYLDFYSSHSLKPDTSQHDITATKRKDEGAGARIVSVYPDAWVFDLSDIDPKSYSSIEIEVQEPGKMAHDAINKLPIWTQLEISLNENSPYYQGFEIESSSGHLRNRVLPLNRSHLDLEQPETNYKFRGNVSLANQAKRRDSIFLYFLEPRDEVEKVANALKHAAELCSKASEASANDDVF